MLANCLDPLASIVSKIFYHTRPIPDHGKNIPGILTCPVILLDPLIGYVSKIKKPQQNNNHLSGADLLRLSRPILVFHILCSTTEVLDLFYD